MSYLHDFVGLIYPRVCQVCGKSLFRGEKTICTKCYHHLPRSRFAQDKDNPAAQVFWGRVQFEWVYAAFLYNKGNALQQLIHNFKYRNQKDVGTFLGREMGKEIASIEALCDLDYIIPVPLHPKKLRKRGFNQSEVIAKSLAASINARVNTSVMIRKSYSSTQTRKTKYERWQNVEQIFHLKQSGIIEHKHILLVDDVITTGATLEACAQTLFQAEGVRVSVGAAAFTGM